MSNWNRNKPSVSINSRFWNSYIDIVKEKMLPFQWDILHDYANVKIESERDDVNIPTKKSHVIENFLIAAGKKEGQHYGWLFQDSDLYKWIEEAANIYQIEADSKLLEMMANCVEIIEAAQEEDGYLSTFYQIEAPYILYNNDTKFYYLFTSFGGLDANGSYNIRVARSKNVEGPYEDLAGQDMMGATGKDGTFFDDIAIENFGTKLIGNYVWNGGDGEEYGYISPGHNSAYYDKEKEQYFIIFHTRFPGKGEYHEVRVHSLLFNKDGWPMIAPVRYAGEKVEEISYGDIQGAYQIIEDQPAIRPDIIKSQEIKIDKKNINGNYTGSIELTDEGHATMELNEEQIQGKFFSPMG